MNPPGRIDWRAVALFALAGAVAGALVGEILYQLLR
jgi:hypothetical protein